MNTNESTHNIDPFELLKLYKYLRVADVCDGMDGVGHFDTGLMAPEVRPLWHGMRFWGTAFTLRCVPANRPMWKLRYHRRGCSSTRGLVQRSWKHQLS